MSDVLAFVHSNFNIPLEQVQTYYKMWHGVFPRMIIFGEWSHEFVHELHKHGIPAYKCPYNAAGRLAQMVMLRALEKFHHPDFKGYVYIHDDLLVSPAKLLTLDKSKVWIGNHMERVGCNVYMHCVVFIEISMLLYGASLVSIVHFQCHFSSVVARCLLVVIPCFSSHPFFLSQHVLEPWSRRSWPWFAHNEAGGIEGIQRMYNRYVSSENLLLLSFVHLSCIFTLLMLMRRFCFSLLC